MTNSQTTTKTNRYFRAMVVLAMVAAMLLTARPSHASTTFTVTTTDDSGAGSLRQAILDANNTAGADAINFAVPQDLRDPSTGVATIKPQSELPTITEQVTIDGYTQQDSSVNTLAKGTNAALKVELDGSGAGNPTSGLLIGAKNSVVRGLVINRFQGFGIGFVGGAASNGGKVEGNFIGTDPSGTKDLGNSDNGVSLTQNSDIVVGGTTPEARNIISANRGNGVEIFGFGVGGNNKVQGNLIGTDMSGTANLGNGNDGVLVIQGANDTVGGDSAAAANTIAFNGTRADITGSDGVAINGAAATGDRILRNSIFSNEGLGIDLIGPNENGNTNVSNPNDSGDTDSGPNALQNDPILSSAKTSSTGTTVAGTLNSAANKTFVVRFYSNPAGGERARSSWASSPCSRAGRVTPPSPRRSLRWRWATP